MYVINTCDKNKNYFVIQCYWSAAWSSVGIHDLLLLLMRVGQPIKDFPSQEERFVFPVIESRNKDCIAPTADRIQRHFAAFFAHKTGTNEFC